MEFAGAFETHLTVEAVDEAVAGRLAAWASERGLKFSHIVLERGEHASQPMITRCGQGGLARELEQAMNLRHDLQAGGFRVTRVKVEAAPWNDDVPAEDVAATGAGDDQYFEHHVKLLLPSEIDRTGLASVTEAHGGRLSRNARRRRADCMEERFVTQRCFGVGRETAQQRLESLLVALRMDGQQALEVEQEYVVYDSNLALDAGWLEGRRK